MIGDSRLYRNRRASVDDTLAYLGAIHMILPQCTRVVDVGCGRGAYSESREPGPNAFDLRGAGRTVIGVDVDEAGRGNQFIDEFHCLDHPAGAWPIASGSVELVVSDWTLEHVADPQAYVNELVRVLRPGGAFVARSINRRSGLAALSRLVPNAFHARVLRYVQPTRNSRDVFPALYRMNTRGALRELLAQHFDYTVSWRPGIENYLAARAPRIATAVARLERLLPQSLQTSFIVVARLERPGIGMPGLSTAG